MEKNKNKVFVIDDDQNVCSSLSWLFKSVQYDVEAYENAHLFLEKFNHKSSGCVITDVRLPGMSGLELLENLRANNILIPVVVITGHGDIPMAVRAMKAGAVDFILKPFNEQILLETVQKSICSVDIASINEIKERINKFSPREHQIINLIIEGKLNKQIAHELCVSISTVEAHRSSIMHKMEAKNSAQLIKMYLQVQFSKEYYGRTG